MLDLQEFPLIDHHCHTLVDGSQKGNLETFIRTTSEAPAKYPLSDLQETVTYEAAKRIASDATGRPWENAAEFEDVFRALDYADYSRQLFQSRRYERLFVDTGFSPAQGMPADALASHTGALVHPILRLETTAQDLADKDKPFGVWREELLDTVRSARSNGFIGIKSIVAYRTGLELRPASTAQAQAAYQRWTASNSSRLMEADLFHYMLWETAPLLIREELPLQFHSGYGDPDENLLQGNPLLLREFIEAFCPRGLRLALLHTYPYHREAGYLASVYPGVFFDVSLIIPLGASSARRVVAEALELSPMSRFLFASDAHTRPELFALSADLFRGALSAYFSDTGVNRYVAKGKMEQWCRMILHDNASALYLGKSAPD